MLEFASSMIENLSLEHELSALETKRSVRGLDQAAPELNLADQFLSQDRKRQGTLCALECK